MAHIQEALGRLLGNCSKANSPLSSCLADAWVLLEYGPIFCYFFRVIFYAYAIFFVYSCYPGYEGKNCERCAKAPGCLHGTCDQSWQCNCESGWGGPRCDRELRICQRTQPCLNHATCINDGIGDYLCVCHPSFSGRHCEIYNAGGMSDTKPATESTTTTTKAPTPPPKQCQNDGRCQRYGQNGDCRKCICKPGYAGHFCEENVNECLMRPCSNGGKCFDLSNNFYCECLTGFTGRYCESDVDECALVSGMCYHGGTCENRFGSYECLCPEGYSGKRCEHVDKSVAPIIPKTPLILRIVRITAPQRRPTKSSTTTTTTQRPKESPTTAEQKRTPNIVKNPEHEVKMTRITHELKISSVNGEYSASNNELLIRSDVDRNSDAPDSSAKAMQAMTFVFMALAIVILIAILALIYLRCFRKQGNSTNKKSNVESVVSTVEREINARRGSRYDAGVASAVDETHSDSFEDSDDASMQIEPCITNDGQTYNEERESLPACPSPPPPYVLSALDTRRTTSALPLNGYYVALPPVVSSRDSCQNISETSARKSLSTSYGMTSQDSEETTSLLEADSPTLSHKIVV